MLSYTYIYLIGKKSCVACVSCSIIWYHLYFTIKVKAVTYSSLHISLCREDDKHARSLPGIEASQIKTRRSTKVKVILVVLDLLFFADERFAT